MELFLVREWTSPVTLRCRACPSTKPMLGIPNLPGKDTGRIFTIPIQNIRFVLPHPADRLLPVIDDARKHLLVATHIG
jgi:hypothetical protein